MLDVFYGAFSPACFALLGLWLVVVQIRLREWQASAVHRRRSYGVALHFALPGVMSLLALVNPQDPAFWRVSFAVVALGGAVVLATVRGFPARSRPGAAGAPGPPAAAPAGPDQLALAAYIAAIIIYVLIGVLAFKGGLAVLRIEAILLTILVFLGFNVAWLLLFDDRSPAHGRPSATAS
ncbi:MAG: hypothetical protein ACRDND_24380 [Streptosporangiaceae bacterium]